MTDRPIVTLCGSLSRARTDLTRIAWYLAAAGWDVRSPKPAPAEITALTPEQLRNIVGGHSADIDQSRLVVGVAPGGAVGDRTSTDMERAVERSIPVRWVLSADEVNALIADINSGRLMADLANQIAA